MSSLNIIQFLPEYFEKVDTFWNDTGLGGTHRGDNLDVILTTIQAGGHLLLMINDKNEVIGTSWMTSDKRRTYIHHFGIKKEYRRQGLAIKLMNQTMSIANQMGFQIKLEVHRDNIPAINLYKQFGFNYLGEYDILIKRDVAFFG
jgi:ribosomal protein S18 acetylase RimI-like enzyme